MGLFSSNKTTSTTQNQTYNTDGRVVADGGGIGVSAHDSNLFMSTTDAGAVQAGRDVALYGLEANATNTQHLLGTMERLFASQEKVVDISSALASTMAAKATNTADEGLKTQAAQSAASNKNMLLLGAVALGVVLLMKGR